MMRIILLLLLIRPFVAEEASANVLCQAQNWLGIQTEDDEKQKTYYQIEFEEAADEEAAVKTKLAQSDAKLSELTELNRIRMEEIDAIEADVAALDQFMADETEQRNEEHAAYMEQMGLAEKAKNRMQSVLNYAATTDIIESLTNIANEIEEMEYAEQTAQKAYAEEIANSQKKRAAYSKAENEKELNITKDILTQTATDLKQVQSVISDLHASVVNANPEEFEGDWVRHLPTRTFLEKIEVDWQTGNLISTLLIEILHVTEHPWYPVLRNWTWRTHEPLKVGATVPGRMQYRCDQNIDDMNAGKGFFETPAQITAVSVDKIQVEYTKMTCLTAVPDDDAILTFRRAP